MKHLRLALGLLIASSQLASPGWAADTTRAARFYEDALGRYEKNDDAGAIVQLKNALQQDPAYLSAYLLLGQAQLRKGDISGAELSLTTALKMGADRSEVLSSLAGAYMRLGKYKELLEKVQPTGLPASTALDLWLIRAYAHLSLTDYTGADAAINQAAALAPNAGSVAIARGMYYLQRGNLAEARRFANQATSASPKDPRSWNLKASIAHAGGDFAAALDGYGRALAVEPGFVDVRVARAGLSLDMNRLDDAFKDLSFLKEKHPDEPRAAYLRSVYFSHKGDNRAANAELLQSAKVIGALPPGYVNGNMQLLMLGALTNFGIKAYEQAENYANGYIRLNPGHPGARKLLGAILLKRGQSDAAITQLENANRAAPRDPQILNMLAAAYMSGKQHAKAANLLEQAGPIVFQSPQLASTLGFSLIGLGRQELGLEYLSQAYTKNPADYRLGSNLVMFNIQRGNAKESVRIAEAFRGKHPNDPTAYNLLGVAKAGARDYAGARSAYEKAISQAPDFHTARLNLGKLETALGNHDAARKQFQSILKSQAKHAQALFEMGTTELAAGRGTEALRWLQMAHTQSPRNTVVAVKLIDTHLRLGQIDQALELAKSTAALAPDDFNVMSALGRSHAAAGQTDRARTTFANMSKLAGFKVEQLEQTARLQLAVGDQDGAALSLNKALGDQPNAIEANSLMAKLELRKGQTAQAQDRVKRLAAANPRSAPAQRTLGDISMASGQTSQAVQAYRAALQADDSAEHALRYQESLRASGSPPQALSFLEDWSRRHPQAATVKLALGEAQLHAGQLAKARTTYEAYVKQHGDHAIALNNLANVLMKQGDANALAMAERAYKLAPNAAPVNDTLGWLLLQKGEAERALRHLREARSRTPNDPEIHYHLAAALHRAGRTAEAIKELNLALESGRLFNGQDEARQLQKQIGR